ncbi:MAG: efflux RND transporter periplasmic adaptor subunit [Myxococcales bacterium]
MAKFRKQTVLIPALLLGLSGLLVWRVRAQSAYQHAPSGGSATIEGVETVVSPKVAGRLIDVRVEEGDRVTRGQVVATLDCLDQQTALTAAVARVKSAEAQVAVAETGLAGAQRNVAVTHAQLVAARAQETVVAVDRGLSARNRERAEKLQASGSISTTDLDHLVSRSDGVDRQATVASANVRTAQSYSAAAQSSILTAKAQIEAARAAVEAAKADQKRAEVSVAECTLVAPRDGIVTERVLEPGAVVAPGVRVLNLVDLSTGKVIFFLPNAELGRARIDADAEVRVDAYPTRVFRGKVRRIASEAEFTPRNVQTREDRDRLVYAVEILVPNPEGLLRAGMPCEVVLPGTER